MSWFKSGLILSVLVVSLFLGDYLKPKILKKDFQGGGDIASFIPNKFGEWVEQKKQYELIKPSSLQSSLDRIYSQILERTYMDSSGNMVMLSIAYGENQKDSMSIHLPEGCYYGQGFSVTNPVKSILVTSFGRLPIKTLVAVKYMRNEPITYWVKIGNKVVGSSFEQKIEQLSYGLKGEIPDGLVFRVSSISEDGKGYKLQRDFINSLLNSLDSEGLKFFIGGLEPNKVKEH